jgi:hypothetical protein
MGDPVLTVQTWEDTDSCVPVQLFGDIDSSTCLVSFQQHWNQASDIIKKSWVNYHQTFLYFHFKFLNEISTFGD